MFAKYTGQASDVMVGANRLLDRFCFLIYKALGNVQVDDGDRTFMNQMKLSDIFGSTRFTRLRLWTQGNLKDSIDGFCNNPHVDRDAFVKEFQELAKWLLDTLKENDIFNKNDIEYLLKVCSMGRGQFQTPTVCGYDIVHNVQKDDRVVHACFALLGLRVSVKVCHCYHYFFPTTLSHCTPWPITFLDNNTVVTTTHGEINVVGWGGGNSAKRSEFYRRHGGPAVNILTRQNFINWLATIPQNLQSIARNGGLLNP